MDSSIYMFNLENNLLHKIEDGRIGHGLFRFIPCANGGYALYTLFQQKIHFINQTGAFMSSDRIQAYEGFSPDYEILDIAPYKDGLGLITYEERGTKNLLLAVLDTSLKTIDITHAQPLEYRGQWANWYQAGTRVFFIDRANGQVRPFDPDKKTYGPPILTAREKVINASVASIAKSDRSLEKVMHNFVITDILPTAANTLKLRMNDAFKKNRAIEWHAIEINTQTLAVSKIDRYTLFENTHIQVIHDLENGEVIFKRPLAP